MKSDGTYYPSSINYYQTVSNPTTSLYFINSYVNPTTFENEDVLLFSEDVSLDNVNISKENHCLAIEILTHNLIDEELKAYSYDGKFFVEFLEESFDEYPHEVLKQGWESPFGTLEFSFSDLYDVEDILMYHINGILHITVPKFEKYFRKDFEINKL